MRGGSEQDMIYINEYQAQLIDLLREKPDLTYVEIAEITEWPTKGISERCRSLMSKGLVERKGNQRVFTHHVVEGIEYTATIDGRPPKEEELPDGLMEHLKRFKVTDEQRRIISANQGLSRREFARKLGISKLEVNLALLQMGIGEK